VVVQVADKWQGKGVLGAQVTSAVLQEPWDDKTIDSSSHPSFFYSL